MRAHAPRLLGQLEAAVLTVLWDSSTALSVRDVLARMTRRRLAYTTILTVLGRLHEKGLVARTKDGQAFLYRPSVSREALLGEHAARLLTATVGPPDRAVLMAFLDSAERSDPGLVERLSALIDARRKGREP
jgi:predicted transcriptional regulator